MHPLCSVSAADDRLASPLQSVVADRVQLAQRQQCQKRAGPFVTQDTAWQRWRQARSQGQAVSQSVFPCYDPYGTRGYCFNVFYAC